MQPEWYNTVLQELQAGAAVRGWLAGCSPTPPRALQPEDVDGAVVGGRAQQAWVHARGREGEAGYGGGGAAPPEL